MRQQEAAQIQEGDQVEVLFGIHADKQGTVLQCHERYALVQIGGWAAKIPWLMLKRVDVGRAST